MISVLSTMAVDIIVVVCVVIVLLFIIFARFIFPKLDLKRNCRKNCKKKKEDEIKWKENGNENYGFFKK